MDHYTLAEMNRHKSPHTRPQCRTWWEAAGSLWAAVFMHGGLPWL